MTKSAFSDLNNGSFTKSAAFYDGIYGSKNYKGEVEFLLSYFKKLEGSSTSVCDIGCGTGVHAEILQAFGFSVTGIDRSDEMLEIARNRGVTVFRNDFVKDSFPGVFDYIYSLFHVMSYVFAAMSLEEVFRKVFAGLNSGGFFVFDAWLDSGEDLSGSRDDLFVIGGRQVERTVKVSRTSEKLREIRITLRDSGRAEAPIVSDEVHVLSELTVEEICIGARSAGFELMSSVECFGGGEIRPSSKNGIFVLRKP